jgi:hypothetical protein
MKLSNAIKLTATSTAMTMLKYDGSITMIELMDAEIGFNASEINVSFENEKAYNNFASLVKKYMAVNNLDAYILAYPKAQMDKNGNYTYNSKLWV